MTLLLIYKEARSTRICEAANHERLSFRQWLKKEKIFYNKERVGKLLIHLFKICVHAVHGYQAARKTNAHYQNASVN